MFSAIKIRAQIERAAIDQMDLSPEVARDVSFHMTDWLDDLHRYVKFCENPDNYATEEVDKVLISLLVHAPNHIAAAAKLYGDFAVSDVFEVGATGPNEA